MDRRFAVLIAAALLASPALAQPAAPPASPPVAMTLAELDFLIQQAADTPARWSYGALQLMLAKRQQATAPTPAAAPAPPQEPGR